MKKFVLLIFIVLFGATPVWAAPTIDFATKAEGLAPSTATWNHTTAVGATVLMVFCGNRSLTSVLTGTYGGSALTELSRRLHTVQSNTSWIFYRVNPNVGTNSIVITPSAGTAGIGCISATFTASATTAPINAVGGEVTTAADAPVTVNVTCAAGNLAVAVATAGSTTTYTSSNTRIATEMDTTLGANQITVAAAMQAGAGSTTMTEDPNSVENQTMVGACIEAAPAAPKTFARPAIIVQ